MPKGFNYKKRGLTLHKTVFLILMVCPSKNFNTEKCWDSVVFCLIFSEFSYVTEFFYVPHFFYVFLKNQCKNLCSNVYTGIFEKTCGDSVVFALI